MVIVYFETPNHSYSEKVAIFANEELYNYCLPRLEQAAHDANMVITESVYEHKDMEEII